VSLADAVYVTDPDCGVPCDFDGDGIPSGAGDYARITPHIVGAHKCEQDFSKPGFVSADPRATPFFLQASRGELEATPIDSPYPRFERTTWGALRSRYH
jgi:hypothetical protein